MAIIAENIAKKKHHIQDENRSTEATDRLSVSRREAEFAYKFATP